MKDIFVSNLKTDEEITTYLMVKAIALKVGSNRKTYLDLVLGDSSGEINGKKWDIADEEIPGLERIKEGNIIKVRALVTEWNGMKQLRISRIRLTGAEDELDISDFVKAAPEKPEDMYEYIYSIAESLTDHQLSDLCKKVLTDHKEKLMYYPAA